MALTKRDVLVTGGTGYIGSRLIPTLIARGHRVRALSRPGAVGRVPAGAQALIGDALDASSVAGALREEDTLVHLIGTPHPNPSKADDFVRIDLASVRASVDAALRKGVAHYVYVSVAQPAPVMKAYVAARAEAETLIQNAKLTATVLRPWYVLGPGHWWPVMLTPVYALATLVPALRDGARRMGLITLGQMVAALAHAVENPPAPGTFRVVEVPAMRAF
jgi:uncharacterized protein YbjT (DUF2867 family)